MSVRETTVSRLDWNAAARVAEDALGERNQHRILLPLMATAGTIAMGVSWGASGIFMGLLLFVGLYGVIESGVRREGTYALRDNPVASEVSGVMGTSVPRSHLDDLLLRGVAFSGGALVTAEPGATHVVVRAERGPDTGRVNIQAASEAVGRRASALGSLSR